MGTQLLHKPLSLRPGQTWAIASGRTRAESLSEAPQLLGPRQGPCLAPLPPALQMLCAQVGADLTQGSRGTGLGELSRGQWCTEGLGAHTPPTRWQPSPAVPSCAATFPYRRL